MQFKSVGLDTYVESMNWNLTPIHALKLRLWATDKPVNPGNRNHGGCQTLADHRRLPAAPRSHGSIYSGTNPHRFLTGPVQQTDQIAASRDLSLLVGRRLPSPQIRSLQYPGSRLWCAMANI